MVHTPTSQFRKIHLNIIFPSTSGSSKWSPSLRNFEIKVCNIMKLWEYNEEVHQLFIDFKKAYDSVIGEVLYKILMAFGVPRKLVRLIKMSLTETYSIVRIGKQYV
jgi:hypothetical protein